MSHTTHRCDKENSRTVEIERDRERRIACSSWKRAEKLSGFREKSWIGFSETLTDVRMESMEAITYGQDERLLSLQRRYFCHRLPFFSSSYKSYPDGLLLHLLRKYTHTGVRYTTRELQLIYFLMDEDVDDFTGIIYIGCFIYASYAYIESAFIRIVYREIEEIESTVQFFPRSFSKSCFHFTYII